ncbi:50S ribosomal protein L10 [Patescibacteria group bacterium]
MAIDKEKKKQVIDEVQNAFLQSKSLVLVDPTGLNTGEIEEIRDKLSETGIKFKVAKKNLIQIAEKAQGLHFDPDVYSGSLGLIISYDDEVEPIQIVYKLSKKFEKLQIRGGVFQNKYIKNELVTELANIPSKEILYVKLVGSIAAPISGLVNVLSGNTRSLVNILNNYQNSLN